MTGRGTIIQGGLAAIGLLAAYATWQREPERTTGDVVVVDVSKNDLSQISYEDERTSVQIDRTKEDGEPAIWLTVKDKPQATDPAKTASEQKPVPPPKVKPPRQLRGQESAFKMWDSFTPLRALRGLGVLDQAKLKELKLDESKQRITLTVKGSPRQFVVANPAGVPDYYLRDMKDGRVYTVPRSQINDLMNALGVLVDRRLHTWKQSDFDRLTIKAGDKQRELVQLDSEDSRGGKLAPAIDRDKVDELAKNWHDKLWRVYVGELLGKGEVPPEGQPTTVVRVDYQDRGRALGWVEIGKVPSASAAQAVSETAPPAAPVYYARSEHTAGWVKLGNDAAPVANEVEKVVSTAP